MLRDLSLADVITLANGFAGTASILAVLKHLEGRDPRFLWIAFAALPFAAVADYLDGRVARWRRKNSQLGADLDSLADLVSFGVAPAVLGFAVGMRGGLDAAVFVYFVGCGISRLARYNATAASLADESGKVPYFEGTPIPTSLALVGVLAILTWQGRILDALPGGGVELFGFVLHPLALMYVVSGSAMISKTLRIPKP
ncbi:MAG: CDP-alcohol phosphatidyltransferase family protein [Polyangiaceae bacterium]|nr:CDP-alcohol phosphatidyltransferase family protein [Polyangiaceae bacterium]